MTMTASSPVRDDAELQRDVLAEVARDGRFRPAEIGVEVDDGVVTLTGTVSSYTKLVAAADIAAEISGVKGVANELTVPRAKPFVREDADIVAAARNSLHWDADVPDEKIDVIVRNGYVTLKGIVDYWYERKAAVDAVTRISGVVAVRDELRVRPRAVADADIAADISEAIARRTSGAARISVEVDEGVVTLRGSALTFHDRMQAARAAWSAKGVRSVDNEVAVHG